MRRRDVLAGLATASLFAGIRGVGTVPTLGASASARPARRVRPGDPGWPSDAAWEELNRQVEGRLMKVQSPLIACVDAPFSTACAQTFNELKNPYYLGDEVGLTQSLDWVGAWTPLSDAAAPGSPAVAHPRARRTLWQCSLRQT
jgi:hypothetical protein